MKNYFLSILLIVLIIISSKLVYADGSVSSPSSEFSGVQLSQTQLNTIVDSLSSLASKNDLVQWVSNFLALSLGLAGIFGLADYIRRRLYERPEMKVSIEMNSPDCLKIPVTNQVGQQLYETYYLRFKIENTGNYKLENAELAALELYIKGTNSRYKKVNQFLPMNLKWANHENGIVMPTISSLFPKHCDLGHVIENPHSDQGQNQLLQIFGLSQKSNAVLILDTQVTPNTGSNYLLPGEYKLKIVSSASNSSSRIHWYKIKFKDSWDNNEQNMLQNIINIEKTTAIA